MAKNKKRQFVAEIEDDDSEINTVYGDLVTFIMTLFILLFVLSYNENKDDTFFVKMRMQFGAEKIEQKKVLTTQSLLISDLEGYIEEKELEEEAQILVDEQKIKLILYPTVLFKSGEAELSPEGVKLLRDLGKKFKDVLNPIMVEGHTDNVPITTEKFESNWVLSFHRAYSVVQFFIKEHKMSPKLLSAIGYGEYHPIAPNDTPENRAKNRRIEINIVRLSRSEVGNEGLLN